MLTALAANQNKIPANQKLRMAEAAVAQFYVDTVNEDRLVETAIRSMLEELDPHSAYSNPEETKELNEPLAGNFSGIGISFNMNQDTLYVISTVEQRCPLGKSRTSCWRPHYQGKRFNNRRSKNAQYRYNEASPRT